MKDRQTPGAGPSSARVEIGPVPEASADDAALVAAICEVVNRAYDEAERGLWTEAVPRTTPGEMAAMIAAGRAVVARRDARIVGAVWTRMIDAATGWFGALGVDPAHGGTGVARALVDHVERRAARAGATTMRLELLVARPAQAHGERLARWYARRGYREVARVDLAAFDPPAMSFLAVEACDVATLEKPLVG